MVEQSKLLKQAEQLKLMIHDWIPKREASVRTLRALAEKLMEHHNNVCIAKVAGSSASVAGLFLGQLALVFLLQRLVPLLYSLALVW